MNHFDLLKNESHQELEELLNAVTVTLKSSQPELIKLNKDDFLPRYNVLQVEVENGSTWELEELSLTVRRLNSKIGGENFDTFPAKVYNLKPQETGNYEFKVFDPFNERFNEISIELTNIQDWTKRKKVDKWLNRSKEFGRKL